MKEIPLTFGLVALVDDGDFDLVSKYAWWAQFPNGPEYPVYAQTKFEKRLNIYMHALLVPVQKGFVIDHRNLNGCDNRRENLRIGTRSQNGANAKLSKANTSGFKGVTLSFGKWHAQIMVYRENIPLGRFVDKVEAAHAYDAGAVKYFGEFACNNQTLGLYGQT